MPKRKTEEKLDNSKKLKVSGHWTMSLVKSMEEPKLVVKSDDLVVIIKDAFPKAEFHYLVLPKQNISSLKVLKSEDISILEHMDKVASELVSNDKHKHKIFKMGYHAEPSMQRLHLHVISDDMNSPCLKTKKHWNSFTTKFFLDSKDVQRNLRQNGKVTLPSKDEIDQYMKSELKCHKCDYIPKHIPDLKKHILTHS